MVLESSCRDERWSFFSGKLDKYFIFIVHSPSLCVFHSQQTKFLDLCPRTCFYKLIVLFIKWSDLYFFSPSLRLSLHCYSSCVTFLLSPFALFVCLLFNSLYSGYKDIYSYHVYIFFLLLYQ